MPPNFKNIINDLNNKKDSKSNIFNKHNIKVVLFVTILIILSFSLYNKFPYNNIFNTNSQMKIYLETEKATTFVNDVSKVNIITENHNNIKWNTIEMTIIYNPDDIDIVDESGIKATKIYHNLDIEMTNKITISDNDGFIILSGQQKQDITKEQTGIGYFYIKGKQKNDSPLNITNASIYITTQNRINTDIDKKGDVIRIKEDIYNSTIPITYTKDSNNTNTNSQNIDNISNYKIIDNNTWITDIKGHWAYDDILKLKPYNILYGEYISSELAKFHPNQEITQKEFLEICFKLFNINNNDILSKAKELELIDNDNIKNPITKIGALKILYQLSSPTYFDKNQYIIYPDIPKNSSYSQYIAWSIDQKINKIIAYDEIYFKPYNNITKAETVTIIVKLKKL